MTEAESGVPQGWKSTQAYAMAVICLLIGVVLGYLYRGSESPIQAAPKPAVMNAAGGSPAMPQPVPTLDDMKRMADKQAAPLLAKLKADPNNSSLLNQIGTLYKATHQFKEAAAYYQKAIEADSKNVAARTDLASCLYYEGDADGALSQLQQSLRDKPGDPNSLFNVGLIRLQAKHDSGGAVSAWQQLLKLNPQLSEEKKAQVKKLIVQARTAKFAE